MKVKQLIAELGKLDGEREVYYLKPNDRGGGVICPINKAQTETKYGDAIFLTFENG